jgi:hypothetical protein
MAAIIRAAGSPGAHRQRSTVGDDQRIHEGEQQNAAGKSSSGVSGTKTRSGKSCAVCAFRV